MPGEGGGGGVLRVLTSALWHMALVVHWVGLDSPGVLCCAVLCAKVQRHASGRVTRALRPKYLRTPGTPSTAKALCRIQDHARSTTRC